MPDKALDNAGAEKHGRSDITVPGFQLVLSLRLPVLLSDCGR